MAAIERSLRAPIESDALARGKMALISGPRQVGKSTLARTLLRSGHNEFNWDDERFRRAWTRDPAGAVAGRGPGPILLDEIHKDRQWKRKLKGLYDLRGQELPIVVTGSGRLDLYRRGGDSLSGRYLPYRLHPFSVGESPMVPSPDALDFQATPRFPWGDLVRLGGFPEPLLDAHELRARRWSRLRRERLVAEEVRDFRAIHDLQAVRVLVDLLPERVGSLLSVNALAEDVGAAYATVRAWLGILGDLYHCFLVRPWQKRVARSLRAAPKLYLYDIIPVASPGARRENVAALHLLKACQVWTDLALGEFDLHFVRTRDGAETDFLLARDGKPWMLVECKGGDTTPDRSLVSFAQRLGTRLNFQLVESPGHDREWAESGVRVLDYQKFFAAFP
ncbi:MAG: ATP-binding protein [Deltaproteobacteria bacterium]|nr:ATP-binding protein [Deltaproteobacteria bacterium]